MELAYTQALDLFKVEDIPVTYDKVQTQLLVEKMFNRKQQRNLLRKPFEPVIEPVLNKLSNPNIVLDVLGILAIRKEIYITSVIEMLIEKYDVDKSKQEIAVAILEAGSLGLLTGITIRDNLKLYSNYVLPPKTLEIIDQYQYLLPMIVPPLPVGKKNNKGSGYYTIGSDSLILNNNHHNGDLTCDVLNKLNSTALRLNQDLIKTVRNHWSGIDEQAQDETEEEFADRVKAFECFEKRFMFDATYLLNQDNKFYLTHKFDKRGRVYSCGYTINTQGNSYQKAVIELHSQEYIDDCINFF